MGGVYSCMSKAECFVCVHFVLMKEYLSESCLRRESRRENCKKESGSVKLLLFQVNSLLCPPFFPLPPPPPSFIQHSSCVFYLRAAA